MQTIPITNDARQTFLLDLGGQAMRLTAWYQDAGSGWYLTIAFEEGDTVIEGARITSFSPMTQALLNDFEGDILCVTVADSTGEPERQAWNNTHLLLYLTEAELETAGYL